MAFKMTVTFRVGSGPKSDSRVGNLGWGVGRRQVEPTLYFPPLPSSQPNPTFGLLQPTSRSRQVHLSLSTRRGHCRASSALSHSDKQAHKYPNTYISKATYISGSIHPCPVSPGLFLPSPPRSYSLCLTSPLSLPCPSCPFQRTSEVHIGTQVSWSLSLSASARSMGLFWLWPRPGARCLEAFKSWQGLLPGICNLGSGSNNSSEIKGLQGRDAQRGPATVSFS